MRRRLLGLAIAALTLMASAGSAASADAPASPSPVVMPAHGPPTQILGLTVTKENVAKTLATDKRTLYVDQVGLYSYREPSKLLEATLELARFRSNAPANSTDFEQSIVGVLSGSAPIVVRLSGQPVYITTSKGLTIAVWFRQGYMLALSIRNTYVKPKELLRDSLGVNP